MSLAFLKEREKNKEKQSNKNDFRSKCLKLLDQIKGISEEKYSDLNAIYIKNFSSPTIQKKRVIGFYGQLKNELNALNGGASPNSNNQLLATNSSQHVDRFVRQCFSIEK